MLSVVSTTHDIHVQKYPKQVRLWGMISSLSLRCPGYARDCHLDVSGSGGRLGDMYQGGTAQCSRLGLVHMLLASCLRFNTVDVSAISCAVVYDRICVETTRG